MSFMSSAFGAINMVGLKISTFLWFARIGRLRTEGFEPAAVSLRSRRA